MTRDPIVDGVHKTRESLLKRFNNDLHAYFADARKRYGLRDRADAPTVAQTIGKKSSLKRPA